MMKSIQYIVLVVLALLYLGGAYAQVSGVTFPPTGTGNHVYGDFKGKGKDPVRPTISSYRHIPMVKPVEVSQQYAITEPESDMGEDFRVLPPLRPSSSLLVFSPRSCSNRAPPHLHCR